MNLHFGIPQIIVTIIILCQTSIVWYKGIGKKYNTLTSFIACAVWLGLLYWGGFIQINTEV